MASELSSRGSRRTARSTVRLIVKKRWPSGVSTIWVTTRPGVWKLACRFQRGQVPPIAREGKALAGEALGDVPGRIDPQHEEGDAPGAGPAERGQPVRDLLDAGAELGAQPVDVVAVPLRRLEEGRVGHQDRPGRIIGEAHVEQAPGRRIRRRRAFDHPQQQRPEFDEGELVGEAEGAALRPEQGRQHQPLAVQVVMLAGAVEQLGRHDPRLDAEPLLEPPPQRLGDGERVAERAGERFGRLLQIGEMVALRLDEVAHPALRGERRGGALVRPRPLPGGCRRSSLSAE